MARYTAVLAGATGLVGGECLRQLLASRQYAEVVVVGRNAPGGIDRRSAIRVVVVDFDRLDDARESLRGDHVFCALGTTIAKAGSRERFRQVDHDYPLHLARITRGNGASHFSIVSALGASARSPVFYSRVKGEVEDGLKRMDWPSLGIIRPSLIAGERTESRPLERLAARWLQIAPAKWRPVPATEIAAAMLALAARSAPGVRIVESRDIPRTARSA